MSIKLTVTAILLILLSGLMISCASTTEENIERITIGMNKPMVLDIIGDPSRTSRHNSVDQWIYKYYRDNTEKHTMVSFKGGQVINVKDYNPHEEEQNSYKDYSRKVKEERKSKDKNFKNLDE